MANFGTYLALTGVKATASLAAKQYYGVKLSSTAGEVKICSSCKDVVIGLVQNNPAAGEAAIVAVVGEAIGIAGTAITLASFVTVNTSGQLEATTTDNRMICGQAQQAAANTGDLIKVLLFGPGRY